MAKHDESKDLRLVGRVCKINFSDRTITCNKQTILGIHMLGKIDYLTHYCGWSFFKTNEILLPRRENDGNSKKKLTREDKKNNKEHKLTNKKK